MKVRVNPTLRQALLLACAVFALRFLFIDGLQVIQHLYLFSYTEIFAELFHSYTLLFFMILADIYLIRFLNRYYWYGRKPLQRLLIEIGGLVGVTLVGTLLVNLRRYFGQEIGSTFELSSLIPVSIGFFTLNLLAIVITDLTLYMQTSQQRNLAKEIEKRNKARDQYDKLKRQLNPHFLFNSLNVLDYLVHTDAERASSYLKKLAGVYRYLLTNEECERVLLQEELKFARSYFDLMKERFDRGLDMVVDIPEGSCTRKIVPCGLQTLIENATKHNVVSPDSPLRIEIGVEQGWIFVRNNIQPKFSKCDSNGVGLASLEAQYLTLTQHSIVVKRDENYFEVRLPLMD